MKKIITLVITLFITTIGFSQQIGGGFAPIITDFTVPLMSGVYNGSLPVGASPDITNGWQHLFVMRHNNSNNNYQLQIASSFSVNDRLFFRKLAGVSLVSDSQAWVEIATRGTNSFTGDQKITGNVSIGVENSAFQTKLIAKESGSSDNIWRGRIVASGDLNAVVMGEYGGKSWLGAHNAQLNAWSDLIIQGGGGNVGIGTTNPVNKLDVNGTIHSKEVKVDMIGWSDFVFKKEFSLPTLIEVEKQINEKGHLENIPSEEEVLKNGINLGEMNAKLLQKIEELTLYMINQNKSIEVLIQENQNQNKEIANLKKELVSK